MGSKPISRPLVEAVHVSYRFDDEHPLWAVEDVSFQVRERELLAIVGPSGGGKSTLLRLLAGLLIPTSGHILFDGKPLTRPRPDIGLVFQKTNLLPWRTVEENIRLPLEIFGVDEEAMRLRVQQMIDLVGLEGFEHAYPRQLSGGMQQRAALARALVQTPRLLLLDEPFAALDALTRERMNLELLRIWARHRQTAVMITHSIQEAVFVADRVLVITSRPGRLAGEVTISLPRPRTLDLMATPAFGRLAFEVRTLIAAGEQPLGRAVRP